MKNLTIKTKIIILITAVIIIAGIAVTLTMGFNVDLRNQEAKKIELYIEKEFDVSDIKNIVNEAMQNENVIIQKVEVFEDTVSIIAKDITDEQKQTIIEKINEKYELELSADTTETLIVPKARIRDMFKPYILPFIVATGIILIYMAIRYLKINSLKVILKTVLSLIISEATLISLIAITRLPVGRYTMLMIIVVYVVDLIVLTSQYENALQKEKDEDKTTNKK